MKTTLITFAVAASCLSAAADAPVKNFGNVGSSGDLASDAAWGGTLPLTTDTIQLNQNYGMDLTFSKSCTFEDLFIGASSITNTIVVSDPDVVVKFLGVQDVSPGIQSRGPTNTKTTFKGGLYDLNGKGYFCPSRYGYGYAGNVFVVDGAILTNVAGCAAAYSGNQCALVVANGSVVYANGAGSMMDSGNNSTMIGGYAEFSGGSKIVANSAITTIGRGLTNSTFLVTGEGTMLTSMVSTTSQMFHNNCSNNFVRIEDNAVVSVGGLSVGTQDTCAYNALVVRDAGRLQSRGSATFGFNAASHNLSFLILDDGVFTGGDAFSFAGVNNTLVVSNAAFRLASGKTFAHKGVRSAVRIQGERSEFAVSFTSLFADAKESSVEFSDNARWVYNYLYYVNGGYSNTLSVADGADVTITNFNGRSYGAASTYGNVVRVSDGGTLRTPSFAWSGWDNAIVISNGTLVCETGMTLGNSRTDIPAEAALTDTTNRVVFQGTSPRLTTSGNCYMRYGAIIRFEVPRGGYPNGSVLFNAANGCTSDLGAKMRLEVVGINDDFVRNLVDKMDVTLIKATTDGADLSNFANQVAAVNETIHPQARLYFSEDTRELHLAVKPKKGLRLIFR